MNWPEAERLLNQIGPAARRTLLRIVEAPDEERAEMIGKLYQRDDGVNLADLLVELEDKEWARQWFVGRLRDLAS